MKKLLSILGSLAVISSAVITVISCDTTNSGSGSTASQKMDLTEHLTEPMIGAFETTIPSDEELLTRLKEANPSLNMNEIEVIRSNANQDGEADEFADEPEVFINEAIVQVKPDSKVYHEATHPIFFTDATHPRIGLSTVIKQTDLGDLLASRKTFVPLVNEIKKRLVELNPHVDVEQLTFDINRQGREGTITVGLVDDNNYFLGDSPIILTYQTPRTNIDIKQAVTQTDLGIIEYWTNSDFITPITQKIDSLNEYLVSGHYDITSLDLINGYARIDAKNSSSTYKKSFAEFNFVVETIRKFNTIFANRDLGEFINEPSDEEITNKILELNHAANKGEIVIVQNVNNKVIIRPHQQYAYSWEGDIEFNYTVKNIPLLQSIGDVLVNTHLGIIADFPDKNDTIIKRVKELNPLLLFEELELVVLPNETDGRATIKVREDRQSPIYLPGSVEVIYEKAGKAIPVLQQSAMKFPTIFVDSFLEPFTDKDAILEVISIPNKGLITSQIDIWNIQFMDPNEDDLVGLLSFEVLAKPESRIYRNSTTNPPAKMIIPVYKKNSLENVFLNYDLGTFDHVLTYQETVNSIFSTNVLLNSLFAEVSLLSIKNDGLGKITAQIGIPGFETFDQELTFTYKITNN